METKVCIKCNIEKKSNSDNFPKGPKGVGLKSRCKICTSKYNTEYLKEYYKKNKKLYSKKQKKYSKEKKKSMEYLKDKKKYHSEYWKNNKESLKERRKEYYKENREALLEGNRRWYENNRESIKKQQNSYHKKRRKSDPLFRLSGSIRKTISESLREKGYTKKSKAYIILGCTFESFKDYVESNWEDWMNWDNYGKYNGEENYGWDLDHIVPLSSAKCEEDIIKLNHHTNIQPLCSYVNRRVKRGNTDYYKNQKG